MQSVIKVGAHKIGYGHKPFVIAEVGSNWSSLEDCLTSITQAKMCGADAVKFQAYTSESLYGFKQKKALLDLDQKSKELGFGSNVFLKMLPEDTDMETALKLEWLPKLKEKADAVGIEFMCSAFSPELLRIVNAYVRIHKVASSEMCHVQMLEKLRGYGKPVFMSMAGQHPSDIDRALSVLSCEREFTVAQFKIKESPNGMYDGSKPTPTVLMYCVGGYPSNRYNPRAIADLKARFPGVLIGLSDHSREVYSTTYRQDAAVIEKHVNFVGSTGPDAPHSLDAEEFKDFVAGLTALPEWTGPTKEEKDFITRHKRRLIATHDIPKGAALQMGVNFGVYRSLKDETHALSPWHLYEVDGLEAKRDIKAGDGIGPGDV